MDRELRELERRAAQGDRDAQYRLLIRLHALGNFNLNDLDQEVRRQLAIMLARSLPTDTDRAAVYSESDVNFYPNHHSPFHCPRVGCQGDPDNFTYHELGWTAYTCYFEDEGEETPVVVDYTTGDPNILEAHLYCPHCSASWRVDPGDVEGQ